MRLFTLSGGGTRAAALAAHSRIILKDYKPNVIGGVSSGALLLLPLLLKKHDELETITTSLKLSDIFDIVPVNEKGKVTARGYIRAVSHGAFGSMNNLRALFKSVVSSKEYYTLLSNYNVPVMYVGVTNITTNKFELIKLNALSYERTIDFIVASCSIPMYCNPVKIGDYLYTDGGLKHHNPASSIIRKYKEKIKECVSVYSRPMVSDSVDWGYNGESLGRTMAKTMEIMQNGVSVIDELNETELATTYGIKLKQKFSPDILQGYYDVDPKKLRELYDKIINNNINNTL